MARKPREDVAGAVHHVFNRGNNKDLIYWDDADRASYVGLLATVTGWTGWRCMAYCLMHNHMHLLIETPKPNLGVGMQRLHGKFARRFNDRHGRSGHVFEDRFKANRVRNEHQFWATVRYIAHDPVEAGLCRRPGDGAGTSHGFTLAGAPPRWVDLPRLFEYFAG